MAVDISDSSFTANFCLAILNKSADIDEYLQVCDSKINENTNAGYPPIYYAIMRGNVDLFKKLIEKGASLDGVYDKDEKGNGLTLRDVIQRKIAFKNEHGVPIDPDLKKLDLKEMDQILESKKILFNETHLEKYKNRIKSPEKPESQDWIMTNISRAGYELRSGGYCYGVAHVGVQTFLIEDRDENGNLIELDRLQKRMSRLDYLVVSGTDHVEIAKQKRVLAYQIESNNFKALTGKQKQEKIEAAISARFSNDPKYEIDSEIPNFLDSVEVYHQAHKHKKLVENKNQLSHQEAAPVLSVLSTAKLDKQGGLYIADEFTGVYNEDELSKLLAEMFSIAKKNNYNSNISIQFSANRHAVTLGYDHLRQTWHIIDANKRSILKADSPEAAARGVRTNLYVNNSNEKILLSSNVFCTGKQAHDIKHKLLDPLRASEAWEKAHELTQDKLDFIPKNIEASSSEGSKSDNKDLKKPEKKGSYLKSYARRNGDLITLANIKKFQNQKKSFFQRHKKKILIGSGIFGGALLIGASIASAGLLPLAVVAMVITVTVVTATIVGGVMLYDKIKADNKNKKVHKIKAEPFKKAVKKSKPSIKSENVKGNSFKNSFSQPQINSTTSSVQKELAKKANSNPTVTLTKSEPAKKAAEFTSLIKSGVNPILLKKYDSSSTDKGTEFRNAYLNLDQATAMTLLLKYQDVDHIDYMLRSWANVAEKAWDNESSKQQAEKQMDFLESLKVLMDRYDTNAGPNADNARELFRSTLAKVPDKEVARFALLQYQTQDEMHALIRDWQKVLLDNTSDLQQKELARQQINFLNETRVLTFFYTLGGGVFGGLENDRYQDVWLKIPAESKEVALERFQEEPHLIKIKQDLMRENKDKLHDKDIELIDSMIAKKQEQALLAAPTVEPPVAAIINTKPLVEPVQDATPQITTPNVNPILLQKYDANSSDNRVAFRKAYMQLDQPTAISLILQHQNKTDVGNLITSWNNILQAQNSSDENKNQAQEQINNLNNISTLMTPFDQLSNLEDKLKFIETVETLGPQVFMEAVILHQTPQAIDALRTAMEDACKTNKTPAMITGMDMLYKVIILKEPYNTDNSYYAYEFRVAFRKSYLDLPTHLKEFILEHYQAPPNLTRLKESMDSIAIQRPGKGYEKEAAIVAAVLNKKKSAQQEAPTPQVERTVFRSV